MKGLEKMHIVGERISSLNDLDYYFPLHPLEMDDISVCLYPYYLPDGKRCDHPRI
jgi:hypothetical protein